MAKTSCKINRESKLYLKIPQQHTLRSLSIKFLAVCSTVAEQLYFQSRNNATVNASGM